MEVADSNLVESRVISDHEFQPILKKIDPRIGLPASYQNDVIVFEKVGGVVSRETKPRGSGERVKHQDASRCAKVADAAVVPRQNRLKSRPCICADAWRQA